MLALLILGFITRKQLAKIPNKLQSTLEMIYEYFRTSAEDVIGRKDVAKDIMPFVMTLFFLIVLSNWSELIPGAGSIGLSHINPEGKHALVSFLRPPSTDLNLVSVMAVSAVIYVQYVGVKYLGFKTYTSKFFNFKSPIDFFVGILELFSEIMRTVSFTFRLFGNIFAGEVLVAVIFFLTMTLVPFLPILPLPFYMLEMFVGVIQAFVFCFLVIVLSSVAVTGHGDEHPEHQKGPSSKKELEALPMA